MENASSQKDEPLKELETSLRLVQKEKWEKASGNMLWHYGKFWEGDELRSAVAKCFQLLKQNTHVAKLVFHDSRAKFGIRGMVKDCHGVLKVMIWWGFRWHFKRGLLRI